MTKTVTTKPLTAAEKKWVEKLESVLAECPSNRIGAFTIGDPYLVLYDRSFEGAIDARQNRGDGDFGGIVSSLGCKLGVVYFPFHVHSTAG